VTNPSRPSAPLLEITDLKKRFGGNAVLNGVTLSMAPGEIRGLIGPNGAGKTTLFNVINGILPPDSGTIRFDGNEIAGVSLERVARRGIGRTFQVARVFSEMSLLENLMVPCVAHGIPERQALERANAMLATARLGHLRDHPAVEISGGQKKLLEFIRVMMVEPKLVLLDEPFNGITPALIEILIEMIRDANREKGTSFALISHELPHVSELCHQVTVLTGGKVLMTGKPDEVRNDPEVIDAYLGQMN
jgi:branched-chain amino acid transport system ATP-binding protein